MREFLPWHVIRDKGRAAPSGVQLLEKPDLDESDLEEASLEEASLEDDSPPASGVRSNSGPLTYAVYTLADLEARSSGELSMRMSRASFAALPPRPTPWLPVVRAALVLLREGTSWARAAASNWKLRPSLRETLHAPVIAFVGALRTSLLRVDWKKVATACGIGLGILGVLLFGVLTAAELTDDLKPVRSVTSSSFAPAPPSAAVVGVPAVQASEPEPEAAGAEPALQEAEPAPPIEIVDQPPAPKRGKGKAKAPPAEIFIP